MNRYIYVILLAVFLAGCGARSDSGAAPAQAVDSVASDGAVTLHSVQNYSYDSGYPQEMKAAETTDSAAGIVPLQPRPETGGEVQAQKIIQTAQVDMRTDRFDEVETALRQLAPDAGGFVESANKSAYFNERQRRLDGRALSITLRVPRESFDAVLAQVEALGVVRASNQSAEDVTAQYYDLDGRLATKRVEEERVRDMITRAVKIEDLLALEERLGQIRADIEVYQSQLLGMDRLASFSTIHVELTEVTAETLAVSSEGLPGRMRQAFVGSVNTTAAFLQNALIFLAGAFIPLVLLGVLTLIGLKTARAVKKKRDV